MWTKNWELCEIAVYWHFSFQHNSHPQSVHQAEGPGIDQSSVCLGIHLPYRQTWEGESWGEGCAFNPLLYTSYTHDCVAPIPSSNTVVLDLISNNDETAYMEEMESLTLWFQEYCLQLNVSKPRCWWWTSIGDSSSPTHEWDCGWESEQLKYLSNLISEDLTWTENIKIPSKKQGSIFFWNSWERFRSLQWP